MHVRLILLCVCSQVENKIFKENSFQVDKYPCMLSTMHLKS